MRMIFASSLEEAFGQISEGETLWVTTGARDEADALTPVRTPEDAKIVAVVRQFFGVAPDTGFIAKSE